MKTCSICGKTYPDSYTICEDCFIDLPGNTQSPGTDQTTVPPLHAEVASQGDRPSTAWNMENRSTRQFMRKNGKTYTVYGTVAEINQQQYYQAPLTKIINAIFRGEAYQFGHTTFTSIIRADEIVDTGFPEQSVDLLLFGNVQSIISPGDTIDATASIHSGRYLIRNASINGVPIRLQSRIPASLLRAVFSMTLLLMVCFIHYIASGNATKDIQQGASSLESGIKSGLPGIIVIVFAVWLLFTLFRKFFRGE